VHLKTILRNIFSNSVSYVVTAVIGFLLAPFVVHALGNTGYGLWTLVLSLIGYFGLLDLGIRSSVGRFVARHLALRDDRSVNCIASTAFCVLGAAGVLAFVVTVVATVFFFDKFHVEARFYTSGRIALLIAGFNMACLLPLGVFSSILVAMERFDVLSRITIIGELIRAAATVAVLKSDFGLVGLATTALVITVAEYVAMGLAAKRLHVPLAIHPRFLDFQTLKTLAGFGIYRFIWIIANQLIFYSDSLVIGLYLSAAHITFYAIAGSLIDYGRHTVSLVTDTLFPAATRMDANNDLAGLRELWLVGTKLALTVALPVCIGFFFLGGQFITLWMGSGYRSSAVILIVLTLPLITGLPQYVSALILAGMAKHKVLAYFALAEGVANLILSIILVQKMGVIGVAWGTSIPNIICTGVIVPYYTMRTLKMSGREYLLKGYLRPCLCAVPAAGLAWVFSTLQSNPTWSGFGAEVVAICILFGTLSYFVCLTTAQRADLVERANRFFLRQAVSQT
jgi:O-antigen/teichoic acid export membrane protein